MLGLFDYVLIHYDAKYRFERIFIHFGSIIVGARNAFIIVAGSAYFKKHMVGKLIGLYIGITIVLVILAYWDGDEKEVFVHIFDRSLFKLIIYQIIYGVAFLVSKGIFIYLLQNVEPMGDSKNNDEQVTNAVANEEQRLVSGNADEATNLQSVGPSSSVTDDREPLLTPSTENRASFFSRMLCIRCCKNDQDEAQNPEHVTNDLEANAKNAATEHEVSAFYKLIIFLFCIVNFMMILLYTDALGLHVYYQEEVFWMEIIFSLSLIGQAIPLKQKTFVRLFLDFLDKIYLKFGWNPYFRGFTLGLSIVFLICFIVRCVLADKEFSTGYFYTALAFGIGTLQHLAIFIRALYIHCCKKDEQPAAAAGGHSEA
uniref:Uncharacterized protein n=1 Tax=Panagrolaimus sp. JU765 TaxID=591449 RepID=A0AC34QUF2_9BILA